MWTLEKSPGLPFFGAFDSNQSCTSASNSSRASVIPSALGGTQALAALSAAVKSAIRSSPAW
jgi:hypothetical protein